MHGNYWYGDSQVCGHGSRGILAPFPALLMHIVQYVLVLVKLTDCSTSTLAWGKHSKNEQRTLNCGAPALPENY